MFKRNIDLEINNLEVLEDQRTITPELNYFNTKINYDNFIDILYKLYLSTKNIEYIKKDNNFLNPFNEIYGHAGQLENNSVKIEIINEREFKIKDRYLFWNNKKFKGDIKFNNNGELITNNDSNIKIIKPAVKNKYNTRSVYEPDKMEEMMNKINEEFPMDDFKEELKSEKNLISNSKIKILYAPIRNYKALEGKEVYLMDIIDFKKDNSYELQYRFKNDKYIYDLPVINYTRSAIFKWKNIKNPFAILDMDELKYRSVIDENYYKEIDKVIDNYERFLMNTKYRKYIKKLRMESKLLIKEGK